MDNLFNYIIILFFIISALVSLLKKKKTQAAQDKEQRMQGAVLQVPSTVPQEPRTKHQEQRSKTIDPFEELDIFFPKKRTENETLPGYPAPGTIHHEPVTAHKSEVDTYFEEALKKSQTTVSSSKRSFKEERAIKRAQMAGLSSKPSKLKTDYKGKLAGQMIVNKRARNLRDKLNNPKELKELIILSEILNKPKALKRF